MLANKLVSKKKCLEKRRKLGKDTVVAAKVGKFNKKGHPQIDQHFRIYDPIKIKLH